MLYEVITLMETDNIRLSEELYQQISFLVKLKEMAKMYGFDISEPADSYNFV